MADFTPSNATLVMELDFVFPRSEAYAPSKTFPIAVLVNDYYNLQPNLSALYWTINGKSADFPPPQADTGRFVVVETTTVHATPEEQARSPLAPSTYGSTLLVGYTDVSAWPKAYHAGDSLSIEIQTDDNSAGRSNDGRSFGNTAAGNGGWTGVLPYGCGTSATDPSFFQVGTSFGSISFSVESDATAAAANSSLLLPVAGDVSGCPAPGASWLASDFSFNETTKAYCFRDTIDADQEVDFDTVSCTDRATVPAAARTAIDSAASQLAAGSSVTPVTTTEAGAPLRPTAATGTGTGTAKGTGTGTATAGGASSTGSTTTNAAGLQLPSVRRVLTAVGVASLALLFC